MKAFMSHRGTREYIHGGAFAPSNPHGEAWAGAVAEREARQIIAALSGEAVPLDRLYLVSIGTWPPVDGGIAHVALVEALASFIAEGR